jgi:hypothetical protein
VRGITIAWDELELAFEHQDPASRTALHRSTGEIMTWPSSMLPPVPVDELAPIEGLPARDQYRIMERFIDTVPEGALRTALQASIVGKGAFRRFKDALLPFPDERKRWFSFRDALFHRHILDWLKFHRIMLVEVPAWNLEVPLHSTLPSQPATTTTAGPTVQQASKVSHQELRDYLHAWALRHGAEHSFLFGPAAFAQLANDISHHFHVAHPQDET